jgi:acyl-CoA synthetase (AMP-forming)/AMP-acid ligase II
MKVFSKNFINNYLTAIATYNPQGEFIIFGDRRITWAELHSRTNRLGHGLLTLGINKGDKVAFMFHNTPEFIEINYAIQKIGAIPVPMNYRFTPREIEYQANHCDAAVFLYETVWQEQVQKARPELKSVRHFIAAGPDPAPDVIQYEDLISRQPDQAIEIPTGRDDVCVMIYTGGTTGFPKGVMLTYGAHLDMFASLFVNLSLRVSELKLSPAIEARLRESLPVGGLDFLLGIYQSGMVRRFLSRPGVQERMRQLFRRFFSDPGLLRFGYKKNVRWILPSFPLFHDASYQILVLATFTGNLSFTMPTEVKFDPEEVFRLIEKEKITFMGNVPTGWKMLVDHPALGKYNLSSLTVAASGAGLNPASLKRKMMEKFPGLVILDMFGQTEMTPITTFRIDTDPAKLKDRSIGRPMLNAKIVDDQGQELPQGQIGEIIYQSSTVMKGYYKDEDKTKEVMKDGWFFSGDLGYIDEEGEIRVVERKKECITSGGEKIFPQEIEEIIHEHPKVKDVCVIGVPDDTWGSAVRAVVLLKDGTQATAEEIIEFCKDKMAGYKRPKSVLFADSFPISPVGKVLRVKVREMFGKA